MSDDSKKPPAAATPEDIFAQFGDIFADVFGGRGVRNAYELRVELAITDDEARDGVTKTVTYNRPQTCATCNGAGGTSPPVPCKACKGAGRKQQAQGFLIIQTACPDCKGAGAIHADPCEDCGGGTTLITEQATVDVPVPAGSEHGQLIELAHLTPKLYVELVVGGRPTQMELAMRAVSPEPIPGARVVSPRADERKTQLLTIAAFVIIVAITILLMR